MRPRRAELADKAQGMVVADLPWIPVYAYVQVTAFDSAIEGLEYLPTDTYVLKHITFN